MRARTQRGPVLFFSLLLFFSPPSAAAVRRPTAFVAVCSVSGVECEREKSKKSRERSRSFYDGCSSTLATTLVVQIFFFIQKVRVRCSAIAKKVLTLARGWKKKKYFSAEGKTRRNYDDGDCHCLSLSLSAHSMVGCCCARASSCVCLCVYLGRLLSLALGFSCLPAWPRRRRC